MQTPEAVPATAVQPPDAKTILRSSGPRVVRDALGPLATFYVGWKTLGLGVGVAAATLVGLGLIAYERRHGRPAFIARIALGLVFLRAGVGLITGSAKAYLAQDIVLDVALGSAFAISLLLRKPLAAKFAEEIFPPPPEVRESRPYGEAVRRVTLAYTAYFFICAVVRVTALIVLSVDAYVVVAAVTGAPFIVGLLVWAVRHILRTVRESEEWAAAFSEG